MLMQKKLLLGTNNPGKVKELRQLLAELPGVTLLIPKDLGLDLKIEETGDTYAENAGLKAQAFAQASGFVTLADDSGLEVDALDGAPGLYSARYSLKPGADDADRRAYLLENLSGTGKPRPWTARFRAAIAIAVPGWDIRFSEGVCEGEIIPEERGTNGFGYDLIFFMSEFDRTMAELGDEEKNRASHRGRGVQEALLVLKEVFSVG